MRINLILGLVKPENQAVILISTIQAVILISTIQVFSSVQETVPTMNSLIILSAILSS